MTLLELLKPYFDKAFEIFEKTGEFILEIAPEIVQQFYISQLLHHVGVIVMLLSIAIIGHCIFNQCTKPIPKGEDPDGYCIRWRGRMTPDGSPEYYLLVFFLECVPKIVAIVGTLIHLKKLFLLKFAPYIYMLEWVTDLTAKTK